MNETDIKRERTPRPILSDSEYAALIQLEENQQFKVFLDFLTKRAIAVAMLSTEHTGEQCHWLQGRSQELRDLLNCVKNARSHYEAIKKYKGAGK